jgi:serine/threonine-protein kinase RIM15
VGTPDYMAPEMLNATDHDGPSIDWWAIGCIIYELIVGIPPFNASTVEEVWSNIVNKNIEWPSIGYSDDCMTPEAQDLIDQLLQTDPSARLMNLEDIKHHPFFKGSGYLSCRY